MFLRGVWDVFARRASWIMADLWTSWAMSLDEQGAGCRSSTTDKFASIHGFEFLPNFVFKVVELLKLAHCLRAGCRYLNVTHFSAILPLLQMEGVIQRSLSLYFGLGMTSLRDDFICAGNLKHP